MQLGYGSLDVDDLQDRLCQALGFRIEVERPGLLPEVAAMSAGESTSWLWHTLTYYGRGETGGTGRPRVQPDRDFGMGIGSPR